MENRITKCLKKFNIPYTEKEGVIEFRCTYPYSMNKSEMFDCMINLFNFDNDCEVCAFMMVDTDARLNSVEWATYNWIIDEYILSMLR